MMQTVKLGIYYFLSTSLIIFPTAACGAALGTAASIRYLRGRQAIGSFEPATVSETCSCWHSLGRRGQVELQAKRCSVPRT
jgi:hypothetical protein